MRQDSSFGSRGGMLSVLWLHSTAQRRKIKSKQKIFVKCFLQTRDMVIYTVRSVHFKQASSSFK